MRMSRVLGCIFLTAVMAACAAQQPPPSVTPQPTAEEYYNQGLRAYYDGRFDEAIDYLRGAIQLNPNYTDAYYYLGQVYEKKNMLVDAEQAYKKCIQLNTRYLPAREALGLMLYRLNRFPEAKRELEVAANLNSVLPEIYSSLGEIYLAEHKCKPAMDMFQRALSLNSSFYPALAGLDRARAVCGAKASTKPKAPKAKPEQKLEKFQGGGVAIDPSKF